MLNIVKNIREKTLLEKIGISSENICCINNYSENLNELLCIGSILNIKDDNQLIEELKKYNKFCIWYSSNNSEDLNCYYYLINRITNNIKTPNIYVINLAKYNKDISSIFACTEKELLQSKECQQLLTEIEIKEASNYWEKLEKENADLRLIDNNKLVSMPYSKLETEILNILSNYEEIAEFKFVGLLLLKNSFYINDVEILKIVINKLIEDNKIKVLRMDKVKGVIFDKITTQILSIRK